MVEPGTRTAHHSESDCEPMHSSVRLRTAPDHPHPPFGLYPDPHGRSHTWWALDARAVLALATTLAGLGAVLSFASR